MKLSVEVVEDLAALCHEVNKTFCEFIGDMSQPKWKAAPQWQKESAINGIHFLEANPTANPQDSHKNWMDEKVKQGWVYGPEKNTELKTHPCLLPYEKIPVEQQTKDILFMLLVRTVMRWESENA